MAILKHSGLKLLNIYSSIVSIEDFCTNGSMYLIIEHADS